MSDQDKVFTALALLNRDLVTRVDPATVKVYLIREADDIHIVTTGLNFAMRCDCNQGVCEHKLAVQLYEEQLQRKGL